MTNEQAITVLKMVEAHGLAGEAKKMAIEALEKQIPKKPIDICKTRMGAYTDSPIAITGRCPNCNIKQSFGSLSWHENFNKFCFKCGQPLDWSDENE